jgi:23S rRNA pseudouridine1911/1915/1917 synthase
VDPTLDADGAHDDEEGDIALRPAFGHPDAVAVRWSVPADAHERTPAEVLAHKVRRLGMPRATRVVDGGDLRIVDVDGVARAAVGSERLRRGTVVELWRLPPDRPDDLVVAPRVLHHGDGVVIVDKPGDLAVHPSARYFHNTLTAWLRRAGLPANPCHRLDRETSGVLVCADDKGAERRWKTAFAEGRVRKEYLAVVEGVVDAGFVVDRPLALQGARGLVRIRVVVDDDGQRAVTRFEPVRVSSDGRRTLLRCLPETGRQHQIRAHLHAVGHPIVGDKLYQMGEAWFDAFTRRALSPSDRARLPCARQCLHAARVELDGTSYAAPLPDDMSAALAGSNAVHVDDDATAAAVEAAVEPAVEAALDTGVEAGVDDVNRR